MLCGRRHLPPVVQPILLHREPWSYPFSFPQVWFSGRIADVSCGLACHTHFFRLLLSSLANAVMDIGGYNRRLVVRTLPVYQEGDLVCKVKFLREYDRPARLVAVRLAD